MEGESYDSEVDPEFPAGDEDEEEEQEEDEEEDLNEAANDLSEEDSPWSDEDFEDEESKKKKLLKRKRVTSEKKKPAAARKARGPGLPGMRGKLLPSVAAKMTPSEYIPTWVSTKKDHKAPEVLQRATNDALSFAARLADLKGQYQQKRGPQQPKKIDLTDEIVVTDEDIPQADLFASIAFSGPLEEEALIPCEICGTKTKLSMVDAHQRKCQEQRLQKQKLEFLAEKKARKGTDQQDAIDLSEDEKLEREWRREQDEKALAAAARRYKEAQAAKDERKAAREEKQKLQQSVDAVLSYERGAAVNFEPRNGGHELRREETESPIHPPGAKRRTSMKPRRILLEDLEGEVDFFRPPPLRRDTSGQKGDSVVINLDDDEGAKKADEDSEVERRRVRALKEAERAKLKAIKEREEADKEDEDDDGRWARGASDSDGSGGEGRGGEEGLNMEELISKCEFFSSKIQTKLSSAKALLSEQPASLQKTLKPYQLQGLNWLYLLHQQELNGILADEMGLGKTIQTIALFAQLLAKGDQGPHLIIVPATTLDNWKREFKAWCPSLKVETYYGSQKEREQQKIKLRQPGRVFNILLTTYNLAFQKYDRVFLKKFRFRYLVLDEAHNIKNASSMRHQRLSRLHTERRLLLTGTPLQNNLQELWALLNFLMPKIFARVEDTSPNFLRSDPQQIERMKTVLQPFMLRRLKCDVHQDLKAKIEVVERLALNPAKQLPMYRELLKFTKAEYGRVKDTDAKSAAAPADPPAAPAQPKKRGRKPKDQKASEVEELLPDSEKEKPRSPQTNALLNILMQLQKICNHPCLTRAFYTDEDLEAISFVMRRNEWDDMDEEEAMRNLVLYSDFELHNICASYPTLAKRKLSDDKLLYSAAKIQHLKTMLPRLKEEGHRVLLFSQMTKVLDILEVFLERMGMSYLRLDGSTPVVERQQLIDKYNSSDDFFIFLLSTKAGGLGINLTAADTVIFYDSSFNPQQDRQAEDRSHRMGQERQVTVYRLILTDSVEEHILRRAREKLQLNRAILQEGDEQADVAQVSKILETVFSEPVAAADSSSEPAKKSNGIHQKNNQNGKHENGKQQGVASTNGAHAKINGTKEAEPKKEKKEMTKGKQKEQQKEQDEDVRLVVSKRKASKK